MVFRANAHWLPHLQVESADATLAKIKAAGSCELNAPVRMSTSARRGSSPTVFALSQPAPPDAAEHRGVAGSFCWNELYTDDPAKAAVLRGDQRPERGPDGYRTDGHLARAEEPREGSRRDHEGTDAGHPVRTGCRTSRSSARTRPSTRRRGSGATSSCRRLTSAESAALRSSSSRSDRREGCVCRVTMVVYTAQRNGRFGRRRQRRESRARVHDLRTMDIGRTSRSTCTIGSTSRDAIAPRPSR